MCLQALGDNWFPLQASVGKRQGLRRQLLAAIKRQNLACKVAHSNDGVKGRGGVPAALASCDATETLLLEALRAVRAERQGLRELQGQEVGEKKASGPYVPLLERRAEQAEAAGREEEEDEGDGEEDDEDDDEEEEEGWELEHGRLSLATL